MELRNFMGKITATRSNDVEKIISGYAVKWDKWSDKIIENGKEFYERVLEGAFTESLKTKEQIALYQHDPDQYLGSIKEKTLFLEEDKVGLSFKIILPDNNLGKVVYSQVKRGKLKHASFTFRVDEEGQSWETKEGKKYRTIKKAKLTEISPVYVPAYTDSVTVNDDKRAVLFGEQMTLDIKRLLLLKKIDGILKSKDD